MRNFWLNIPRAVSAVRALELSREAKHRLRMMAWYDEHGRNAALTCRHVGICRDTFYRWLRRFQECGPGGLENGSHRPRHVRTPTWTKALENAVLELRKLTPGWGKDKLVVLLRDQGWQCSTSMVGRILKRLKESGRLVEAPGADPWPPRPPRRPSPGIRSPSPAPSRSGRSRSTAVPSSWPSSRTPAASAASNSSSFHPAPPSSTLTSSVPNGPTRRS